MVKYGLISTLETIKCLAVTVGVGTEELNLSLVCPVICYLAKWVCCLKAGLYEKQHFAYAKTKAQFKSEEVELCNGKLSKGAGVM